MPLSRFQSAATVAKVRKQLAQVHELVQRRAVLDTAVANLAMTLDSAARLCPVRDSVGRVVGFRVLAANSHCTTPAGQRCNMIGKRLMSISPGIGTSGLLEDYIRAYESGEPYFRRAIEHLEISGERVWPVTMTVRAAGCLTACC